MAQKDTFPYLTFWDHYLSIWTDSSWRSKDIGKTIVTRFPTIFQACAIFLNCCIFNLVQLSCFLRKDECLCKVCVVYGWFHPLDISALVTSILTWPNDLGILRTRSVPSAGSFRAIGGFFRLALQCMFLRTQSVAEISSTVCFKLIPTPVSGRDKKKLLWKGIYAQQVIKLTLNLRN